MRTVFMGTPGFSVPVLVALLDAGHEVVGVYTQPDRPIGRRRQPAPSPVKEAAEERGLPVLQPPSLKRTEAQEKLAKLTPDVIVVAAYGLSLVLLIVGLLSLRRESNRGLPAPLPPG